MAILKIARLGHPVLREVAEPVPESEIRSEAVQRLVDDMLATVAEADGAGLAAPQVHRSVRIVVLRLDEGDVEVWINPVVTPTTEELTATFEGCLSVPGMRGMVPRYAAVRVDGFDRTRAPFTYELEDFSAVVAQHECDHLDGILYVDRVIPRTLMFLEEYRRFAATIVDQLEGLEE